MKRLWIVAVLMIAVVAMSVPANAATKFGVKAGLNMAKLSGDGWDQIEGEMEMAVDSKMRLGFGFGVVMQMPLGEGGLMLQPEAWYVMKGGKMGFPEAEAEGYDVEAEIKMDYIEVPILVKYAIPTQGKIAPCLFAGPAVAMNIGAKFETTGADAEDADLGDGDIYNKKDIDFGIVFGGGVDFALGERNKLMIDVRYTLGMAELYDDVTEDDVDDASDDDVFFTDDDGNALELKNSNIQITVGILF